jgi:metal-responsive CopG/Arc/MetJ family transcriptional regulator
MGKMIKTTINLPEDLWKRFAIKVIQEKGGRKKNDVIQQLIEEYLAKKAKTSG